MKNLSIAAKMAILVVVFLATALIISVVGVRQLGHLYITGEAAMTSSEAHAELLASVRAEKNGCAHYI